MVSRCRSFISPKRSCSRGSSSARGITRLHNHFANAGAIVGYLAAGLLDMPWSFTMHGISETDYPAGLLLAREDRGGEFRRLRLLLRAGAGDAPRFARPLEQVARRALRPTPRPAAEGIPASREGNASSVSAGFRRKRVRRGCWKHSPRIVRKLARCGIGPRWRRPRSGGSALKVRTAWDREAKSRSRAGLESKRRSSGSPLPTSWSCPASWKACRSSSWKQWR